MDGRIAYWIETADSFGPETEPTRVVTWDVQTRQKLANRELAGTVLGVDADGIAYVREPGTVTEWDLRADTLRPSDQSWDSSKTWIEQCSQLSDLAQWPFERGYISPDGTRQVFTGPAPGDPSPDCCTTRLRVRPYGPDQLGQSADLVDLPLPEGIPHMTLWHGYSDRGIWSVWWESNATVLLDAFIDGTSYLIRCSANGTACEKVFELGPGNDPEPDQGAFYNPDWKTQWVFARARLSE